MEWEANALYVCSAKQCKTTSKEKKFFKCTFLGSELIAGTAEKPKECGAEQITLAFCEYLHHKTAEQTDYKYIVADGYHGKIAHTFYTIEAALNKLASLRSDDYQLYEIYDKAEHRKEGKGVRKIFVWNGEAVEPVDGPESKSGLHVEWLIGYGREVIPPTDKK